MDPLPKVAIVLPAHNEAENIGPLAQRLADAIKSSADWQIVFVDDGSSEGTLAEIKRLAAADRRIRYVALVRNFGHQIALRAGLHHAEGDAVILIDCDFEHPPELVPKLAAHWRSGAKVVLTEQASGSAQLPLVKRLTSSLFYVVFDAISDVRVEPGSPGFMLLDRAVVEAIGKIREPGCLSARAGALARHSNGANQIHPGRAARWSDQILAATHDGFRDDGDRGAQHQALRIAIYLSFVFALLGVLLFAYSPVSFFWINRTVAGWTSIMSAIAILGAGEFLVLGIMGEYLGRVLREVRRWPLYIVAETEETLATRTMLVSADPR